VRAVEADARRAASQGDVAAQAPAPAGGGRDAARAGAGRGAAEAEDEEGGGTVLDAILGGASDSDYDPADPLSSDDECAPRARRARVRRARVRAGSA
jgi:hypothetical protein